VSVSANVMFMRTVVVSQGQKSYMDVYTYLFMVIAGLADVVRQWRLLDSGCQCLEDYDGREAVAASG
jgi:hypothetical protein